MRDQKIAEYNEWLRKGGDQLQFKEKTQPIYHFEASDIHEKHEFIAIVFQEKFELQFWELLIHELNEIMEGETRRVCLSFKSPNYYEKNEDPDYLKYVSSWYYRRWKYKQIVGEEMS